MDLPAQAVQAIASALAPKLMLSSNVTNVLLATSNQQMSVYNAARLVQLA